MRIGRGIWWGGWSREPFDLASGRLARARLVRLPDGDGDVLVVVMHHVACDVWSLDIIGRELWQAYAAIAAGHPVSWLPLPVQYGDFAVWQRANGCPGTGWSPGSAGGGGNWPVPRTCWSCQATIRARRGCRCAAGRWGSRCRRGRWPRACGGLRHGGVRRRCSWCCWPGSRWCWAGGAGVDDLLVGVPVAGRARAEVEGLAGYFVNTVPVRVRLGGDPEFAVVLGRVREAVLGALAHQEVPFEALVEDLAPGRDQGRNPLVQVDFQLTATPGGGQRRAAGRPGR